MTSISRWAYTSRLTFWSVTVDEFGQRTFEYSSTVDGTWRAGGRLQRDDSSEQFVPSGTFMYEMSPESPLLPKRGWLVAVGEYAASDPVPSSARTIRKVESGDVSMHGEALPDWMAYTE